MQSSHTHIQAHIHQATLHHSFVDINQGIKKPLLWQIPQKSPERVLKSTQPDSQIRPNHFALSVTIVINPLQQSDSNTNLLIGTNGPVIYLTVAAWKVVQRDTSKRPWCTGRALEHSSSHQSTREGSQQHYHHHIHIHDNENNGWDLWEATDASS
jgi:hypothetical protein